MEEEQIPDIEPDPSSVEKKEAKDKKGFLASLFRFGGGAKGAGATFAAGGAGAASGGTGGLAGLVGLLSTKAGIIGLVLVAGTVAAGIGIFGKAFMGGGTQSLGGTDSVFRSRGSGASRLPGATGESGSASADGVSSSLQFFTDANQRTELGEGASSSETGDTGDAEDSQATGDSGETADNDNAPAMGPRARLKGNKIGALSTSFGGSGAGGHTSAAVSKAGNLTPIIAKGAASGRAGAMKPGAARRSFGGKRGKRRSHRSAVRQLGGVRRDHRGAQSSAQSGTTYDGSAVISGSEAGGGIPMGGAGQGGAGVEDGTGSLNQPGLRDDQSSLQPPPTVPGKNVTPWQKAIDNSQMLLLASLAVMYIIFKIASALKSNDPYSMIVKVILTIALAIAILLALAAMYIGIRIATGPYKQTLQGGMVALAGGFLAAVGVMGIIAVWGGSTDSLSSFVEAFEPMLMVGGVAAMAALAVGYLNKPKTYNVDEFDGEDPPDCSGLNCDSRYVPPAKTPAEMNAKMRVLDYNFPSGRALERFLT